MSSTWLQRVSKNILPLSQNSSNLKSAQAEWYATGECHSNVENCCQLCDHNPIRYSFEIKNSHNDKTLWVGSERILRFQISVYNLEGQKLSLYNSRKELQRIKTAEMNKVKRQYVISKIIQAFNTNTSEEEINKGLKDFFESLIQQYSSKGHFSPKQTLSLARSFFKLGIEVDYSQFKVYLRRKDWKEQIDEFSEEEIWFIKPYLTSEQVKTLEGVRKPILKIV